MRGSKARGVPRWASSVNAATTSAVLASVSAASNSRQPTASMLRPVDQADAFLGAARRARCRRAAALRRIVYDALEFGFTFADQYQRHVRQRRQVARCSHAALGRHHRRDARPASRTGARQSAADAGESFGQNVARISIMARTTSRASARPRRPRASAPRCAATGPVARAGCARRPAGRRRCSPRRWVVAGRSRSTTARDRSVPRALRRREHLRSARPRRAQVSAMVSEFPSRERGIECR